MKKTLSIVLMALLVASAFAAAPASAKKKKKPSQRVVEIPYTLGGFGVSTPGPSGGSCFTDPSMPASCKEIPLQVGETHISIEIQDASGTTVPGSISQGDANGDGISEIYGQFCGSTAEPLQLQDEFTPVNLSMYPGVCADASGAGIPTTGTIKVTLISQ